jgi:hypothetical protein
MTDDNGVLYPIWVEYAGNLMCLLSFGSIIVYAIYLIVIDVFINKKVSVLHSINNLCFKVTFILYHNTKALEESSRTRS